MQKNSLYRRGILFWPLAAALAACGAPAHAPDPSSVEQAATTFSVSYNKGPLLSNVQIVQVLYGPGTYMPEVQGALRLFYLDFVTSPYMDFLAEYSTTSPVFTIGHGSLVNGVWMITPSAANNLTTLYLSNVQAELEAQVDAGKLPQPTPNTLYVIHFPRGVVIKVPYGAQVLSSCDANNSGQLYYCGDHSSTVDSRLHFVMLPDFGPGSGCEYTPTHMPCGTNPNNFDNLSAIASHEIAEAITDPIIGAGWIQGDGQEIADLCERDDATVSYPHGTWRVQNSWSHNQLACAHQPPQGNNAAFTDVEVPAKVAAGTTFTATLTAQNTGATTWTNAGGYFLQSAAPAGNSTWGVVRVALASTDVIAPGQSKFFRFNVTAPSAIGSYDFQWQMMDGGAAIGAASVAPIQVIHPPAVQWSVGGVVKANNAQINYSPSMGTLAFAAANAQSCDVTVGRQGPNGPYDYTQEASYPNDGTASSVPYVTSPPANHVYTVKCRDSFGDLASATLTIVVGAGCTGACTPGQTQACGNCGTQTCTNSCTWGACTGQGVCAPGATEACGNCGSATCTAACQWGTCSGQGECAPGAVASCCPCGSQGCGCEGSMTCSASCTWSQCSEWVCKPGLCR